MVEIVKKHKPRKFSAFSHNGGIVLCTDQEGAFLVLRFPEEVAELRNLLDSIYVFSGEKA